MPVVDASVLVAFLVGGAPARTTEAVFAEQIGVLWAPHLVDAEVGHALRRKVAAGELRADAGREALQDLTDFPLSRAPHGGLLQRAWELRDNASFYDGLYLALAEALDEPLLTFDKRLAGVPGTRATVTVIA